MMKSNRASLYAEVISEVEKAEEKFPKWPTDPIHALVILMEEVGELNKDVLQMVYEPHKTNEAKIREEAIQSAAMAMRFLFSLGVYEYNRAKQHRQDDDEE